MADNDMTRFPCECPRCEIAAGYPYRAQTDATNHLRLRLDMRCRSCRYEWRVERTTPAVSSSDLQAVDDMASTFQQPPPTAIAADAADYLDLPVAWVPSKRFDHGQVYEYRLRLDADEVATLRLVADKGWALTIAHGDAQPHTDRGLFATPYDAFMVLATECGFSGHDIESRSRDGAPDSESGQSAAV